MNNNPSEKQSMVNYPTLLTNRQAAAYLSISEGTLEVWRATKRYHIPYLKIGKSVKYRQTDLDAFIASRTIGADTAA